MVLIFWCLDIPLRVQYRGLQCFFLPWQLGFQICHGLQGVSRVCFLEIVTGIPILSRVQFLKLVTGYSKMSRVTFEKFCGSSESNHTPKKTNWRAAGAKKFLGPNYPCRGPAEPIQFFNQMHVTIFSVSRVTFLKLCHGLLSMSRVKIGNFCHGLRHGLLWGRNMSRVGVCVTGIFFGFCHG